MVFFFPCKRKPHFLLQGNATTVFFALSEIIGCGLSETLSLSV